MIIMPKSPERPKELPSTLFRRRPAYPRSTGGLLPCRSYGSGGLLSCRNDIPYYRWPRKLPPLETTRKKSKKTPDETLEDILLKRTPKRRPDIKIPDILDIPRMPESTGGISPCRTYGTGGISPCRGGSYMPDDYARRILDRVDKE
jgi:hypothetical protein